jgi:hypothetical protein
LYRLKSDDVKKIPGILILMAAIVSGCITAENNDEKSQGPVAPGMEASASVDSQNLTTIRWIDSSKNMGTVLEGQKVEVIFRFANTGSKPLVIASATPSCGCTVPAKPEKPVMPGQEGEIKAVFDSQGRPGSNHKTITVVANTEGNRNHVLAFDVNVKGAKDGPAAANTTPAQTSF